MLGKALIQERIVGTEQIENTAVLAENAGDEELGFFAEGGAQVLVEAAEDVGIGLQIFERPQVEPLAGEVLDQRVGVRRGEHARRLGLDYRGFTQVCFKQFVIGNRTPQEEGKARRHFRGAEAVGTARCSIAGFAFDAEEEIRRDQHGFEGGLNAGVEVSILASLFIEPHERPGVGFG